MNQPIQGNLTLYSASIGKKAVVALTGIVLFGFVLQHMFGNLQVFLGQEAYNAYANGLKDSLGNLIWLARGFLLLALVAHIVATMQLVQQSNAARQVGYRLQQSATTTYAAKTMKYTGPLVGLYIVYHLVHFTFPGVAMGDYVHDPRDIYSAFVQGFQIPWVTGLYVAANIMLGLHLHHGAWSLFQTLGLNHPRYNAARETIPKALALVIVTGNILMPVSVLLGVIQ